MLFNVHFSNAQCERNQAYLDYQEYIVNTQFTAEMINWTGDVDNCEQGTISDTVKSLIIKRLNYFRRLSGVTNPISHISDFDSLAQQAVLMMLANNTLTHYPTSDFSCYTEDGAQGAAKSNLAWSYWGASSTITNFIQDGGTGNEEVGHRMWLTWPRLNEVSIGATDTYSSIYISTDFISYPSEIEFYAYPGEGYIASDLVFERWSFAMNDVDFSKAEVVVTNSLGDTIQLNGDPLAVNSSWDALVWEIESGVINVTSDEDVNYHVHVSNILKDGNYINKEYDVSVFNPDLEVPSCPTDYEWSENDCACKTTKLTASNPELFNSTVQLSPNPFTNQFTIQAPAGSLYSIFDLRGVLLESGRVRDEALGDFLAPGTYLVQIMTADNQVKNYQIIKTL